MIARIKFDRMSAIPVGDRVRMRELSLGPITHWGMWSWTFADGSTYAARGFTAEGELVGWAAVSFEIDALPVVGVFVPESSRGGGAAAFLVSSLLRYLRSCGVLERDAEIFAAVHRWAAYPRVIESAGLRCRPWV